MFRIHYSKNDFQENDLPRNRVVQFFDIFKNEWKTLLLSGMWLFVFSLPILGLYVFGFIFRYSLSSVEGGANAIRLFNMIYYASMILGYLILCIAISGVSMVMKNLVYGRGILYKSDFFLGIKQNYGQLAVIIIFYGLLDLLYNFLANYIFNMQNISGAVGLGIYKGIFILIVVPIFLFSMSQTTTYKMSIFTTIKNGFVLYFKSIGWSLLFALFFAIPIAISFFTNIIAPTIILGLVILLVSPVYWLIWRLFSVSRFDILINKDNYPEIYRKGLR